MQHESLQMLPLSKYYLLRHWKRFYFKMLTWFGLLNKYAYWWQTVRNYEMFKRSVSVPLQWRHNGRDSVSNHQPDHCLLKGLFRRRSKKTSKLRVTGLCALNSPGTGEFPAKMASNAENVSIWWRHHDWLETFTFHLNLDSEFTALQHCIVIICCEMYQLIWPSQVNGQANRIISPLIINKPT